MALAGGPGEESSLFERTRSEDVTRAEGPSSESGGGAGLGGAEVSPARVLSVPAVATSGSAAAAAATSRWEAEAWGTDNILQELRRWQLEMRQRGEEDDGKGQDHATRRRNLVRSRSAMDVPDEVYTVSYFSEVAFSVFFFNDVWLF